MSKSLRLLVIAGVTALSTLFSVSLCQAISPPPFILQWGTAGSGPSQFHSPFGVAVGPDGYVYVTDALNYRVQKFTATGAYVTSWGTQGSGPGQFGPYMTGVACDSLGNVFVVDAGNNRIQKFSSAGNYLDSIGGAGANPGQFDTPYGIKTDAQGNIFVADQHNNRIQKFDGNGNVLLVFGSPAVEDGTLTGPKNMAISPTGDVFVVSGVNKIKRYNSAGAYQGLIDGTGVLSNCQDITIDPNGNLLVTGYGAGAFPWNGVVSFSTDGEYPYLGQWGVYGGGPGQFSNPGELDFDGAGNLYIVDGGAWNPPCPKVMKFGPGERPRPVVLVHGYCSDGSIWTDLGNYLSAQGLSPHAISLTPNNGRPNELAQQLASYLDSAFPGQDVDVIAHSLGGLVTRQYIRQRKTNCRIKTLITLGTPHHGVDLLRLVAWDKAFQEFLAQAPFNDLQCLLSGPGSVDLTPGSNFLNNLNYGTIDHIDMPLASSRGQHATEDDYGAGVNTWTIAGTAPFNQLVRRVTGPAWFSVANWQYPLTDYRNDGVVGIDAAVLWRNNRQQARVDTDMGLNPIQHFPPVALYGFGGQSFQSDQALFPILENILRGGTPPGNPPSQPAYMASQVQADSDSMTVGLSTNSGEVVAGNIAYQPFTLPNTTFAQIMAIGDSVAFKLRKPDGTVLAPADTLSEAGLHYTEDSASGLGIYGVESPVSGNWSLVIDASGTGTNQTYAMTVYAVVTSHVSIEALPSNVYGPSTHLTVSLDKTGLPAPNVAWGLTILRPDSTEYSASVYDDGTHGDAQADDGIYGTDLDVSGAYGIYGITATATDPSDGVSYIGSTVVEAAEFKDLAIDSVLTFSRNSIAAGDSLIITGTVRNLGTTTVGGVVVELWDNHNQVATQSLSLGAGQFADVSFQWNAAVPDTHLVELVVNPSVLSNEADYDNNSAGKQIVLGHPITGVADPFGGSEPRLMLAPPMPNPSINQTILRFSLPRESEASLSLFDLLGRRIKQWHWSKLSAGPHQVWWDGKTDAGRIASPGVLFYRLDVGSQHLRQKLIHLR